MLIKHKKDCLSVDGVQPVKLEEGAIELEIILNKYQFHLKFMVILSVIYEGSSTKKYHDYVSCSLAYKVVCIDDRFSKSIVFYRGENAAYKFIKAIIKEYEYCKKVMNKHFNKKINHE